MTAGSEVTDNFPGLGPDDMAAVPTLLSRFVQEQRIANNFASGARERTNEALGSVALALADISAQSIKVSAALADMSERIEHVEGAVATLSANLRDTANRLDSRVSTLEVLCSGFVQQFDSMRTQQDALVSRRHIAPPVIPGGVATYAVLVAICLGSSGVLLVLQWLVHQL